MVCSNNQLTDLDVSNNTALTGLICYGNQLTSLDVRNGNNEAIEFFIADENPNLTCIYVESVEYSNIHWTNTDPNSTFVNNEAECD